MTKAGGGFWGKNRRAPGSSGALRFFRRGLSFTAVFAAEQAALAGMSTHDATEAEKTETAGFPALSSIPAGNGRFCIRPFSRGACVRGTPAPAGRGITSA